jgi:hypothetical protein
VDAAAARRGRIQMARNFRRFPQKEGADLKEA